MMPHAMPNPAAALICRSPDPIHREFLQQAAHTPDATALVSARGECRLASTALSSGRGYVDDASLKTM